MAKKVRRETAKYVQLADVIRQEIAQNRWKLGDQLPTVELLSQQHSVSRITVRQAMDILAKERLISRGRGRGTHVTQAPAAMRKLLLKASWADLRQTNDGNGRSRVIFSRIAKTLPSVDKTEGHLKGPYQHLSIVGDHTLNLPLSIRETYLQTGIYQKLKAKIPASSMLDLMSEFVVEMKILNEIGSATSHIADHLMVPVGTPILKGRHIGVDANERIVFIDFSFLRGDYVKFEITVS